MKIKFAVTLCVLAICVSHLLGQTNSDIYIIGTSISPVERCTGFVKVSGSMRYYHETPSISFIISSVEKDYEVWFNYHDFKAQELIKLGKSVEGNDMAIMDRPIRAC